MNRNLHWDRDGHDWPNRATSRFLKVGRLTWHIQRSGNGPPLLLLHGTGASTHSWRDLLPLLATTFDVLTVDLPGHGFTTGACNEDLSLAGMSAALGQLLAHLDFAPEIVVGHSAGAAILLHMSAANTLAPAKLISLNGALLPFPGLAGRVFPALARALYLNPIVPRLLSWRADDTRRIRRLIEGMGSTIDDTGLRLYTRLFQNTRHMESTIRMMAYWDLSRLGARLATLNTPTLLVTASNDLAVPPETSFKVRDLMPNAEVLVIRGGGHLVHEEQPDAIARIIRDAATQRLPEP